jgi:hypothetical protein
MADDEIKDSTERLFVMVMNDPGTEYEIQKTITWIWDQVLGNKFNKDRAIQVFGMAVDRSLQNYFIRLGLPNHPKQFPESWRRDMAVGLAEKFVSDNGNIQDQRPARKGLMAFIVGK